MSEYQAAMLRLLIAAWMGTDSVEAKESVERVIHNTFDAGPEMATCLAMWR